MHPVPTKLAVALIALLALTLTACGDGSAGPGSGGPEPDGTGRGDGEVTESESPGEGGFELTIEPPTGPAGTVPIAIVRATGSRGFGWGNPYVLERKNAEGAYRVMETECFWTLELILVRPGKARSQAIQSCKGPDGDKPLPPGEYRYLKSIEVDGSMRELSATFTIEP